MTDPERCCPVYIANRKSFDDSIAEQLGPTAQDSDFPAVDSDPDHDHADLEVTPDVGNNYIGVDLLFPKGGLMTKGHITARKRDADGNPKGCANPNPILHTREYTVTFDDGDVTDLSANLIAESMYAQCDSDGNQYVLLDSLIDHQRLDTALRLSDQTTVRNDSQTYQKRNTVGWQICCQWKDSLSSWEKLFDLKESHPLETAKYAVTMGIDHKPAFNWWVPHVLRKRDRIISAVAKRSACFLKLTHKFGIEIPRTDTEALELDRRKGNTLWADTIAKEMAEVQKAFDILPDGKTTPVWLPKDSMPYGL